VPGFDVVAEEVGLESLVAEHDLVLTGEGYLDDESFDGKVVGGVVEMASRLGTPVAVICGGADDSARDRVDHVVLLDRFGADDAMGRTTWCVERATTELLSRL